MTSQREAREKRGRGLREGERRAAIGGRNRKWTEKRRKWRRGRHGGVRRGQRAAAGAGGAGARNRRLPAERGFGDPGAVQGEAPGATPGPPGRPVRRRRGQGGGRALGPDPLPDTGGHGAAPRGLELRGAQELPAGPEPAGLRPAAPGRAGPRLRAHAGAVTHLGTPGDTPGHTWAHLGTAWDTWNGTRTEQQDFNGI